MPIVTISPQVPPIETINPSPVHQEPNSIVTIHPSLPPLNPYIFPETPQGKLTRIVFHGTEPLTPDKTPQELTQFKMHLKHFKPHTFKENSTNQDLEHLQAKHI